jgi:hypothetical protein
MVKGWKASVVGFALVMAGMAVMHQFWRWSIFAYLLAMAGNAL